MEISVTGLSALKKSCTVQEATVLPVSLKKHKQLLGTLQLRHKPSQRHTAQVLTPRLNPAVSNDGL